MTTAPNTPDLDALLAHSGWVRSLAISLVTDPASADEIEQQAWVSALEYPPKNDSNLRSWWSSVVRSAAGKGWREQSRRREVEDELAAFKADSETSSPADLAERHETFRRLAAAVTQLPEPYGEAIFLRYFEELPVREVARRQEVPVDTAQSRINRGIQRLRAAMQENLGTQWRNRCQVFAVPLGAAHLTTLGPAAVIPIALKTPLGIAATLLALFSLVAWAPWASGVGVEEPELEIMASLEAAEEVAEVAEVAASMAIERQPVEPSQVIETGFHAAAEVGSLITVVDRNGNKPLPGAELIALDLGALLLPEEAFLEFAETGSEQFFVAMGARYRTDQNAQVRIPAPKGKLMLVGRTREHFGILHTLQLTKDAVARNEITLPIDLVKTIAVKVVNLAGESMEGAFVDLVAFDRDYQDTKTSVITDADGLAWLKVLGATKLALDRKPMYVNLVVLGAEPVLQEVDFLSPPKEPVVLVMPETGQVELLLQNESGTPELGHFLGGISALVPNDREPGELMPSDEALVGRVDKGRIYFPYVALNRELRARAISPDFARHESADAQGPTSVGETVVITITPRSQGYFLTGRVLNTEGMVAKNLGLKVEVRRRSEGRDFTVREPIQTDAEGYFRLQVENDYEPGDQRSVTVLMRKTKRKPSRFAEKDFSWNLQSGDTDLGDFVVDVLPILVQGRVLSAAGQPVAGATVNLEKEDQPNVSFYDHSDRSGGGVVSVAVPKEGEIYWDRRKDLVTKTDEEGRFTIRARANDCRYQVVVDHRKHERTAKEFVPGTPDFEMSLGMISTIKGRLLLDPEIPVHGVHVYLLMPRTDGSGEYFGHGRMPNRQGNFEFTGVNAGLKPGTYALRVQSVYLKEEFFFIEDFELQFVDGAYTFPDIDLRGRLSAIYAAIMDENKAQILEGRIGPPGTANPGYFATNLLALVSQSPSFNFEITSEGKRGVVFEGVTESQEVVLSKGLPVKIIVDNLDLLPADWDIHTLIHTVQEDGSSIPRQPGSLSLNSAGAGLSTLAWSGKFRISAQIYHARNSGSGARWVPLPGDYDTSDFVVVDQGKPQEVHITLDSVKLQQAIQEARGYEQEWDNRER